MANTPVTNGMSVAQMAAIINTQGEQGDDHETRIDTLENAAPVEGVLPGDFWVTQDGEQVINLKYLPYNTELSPSQFEQVSDGIGVIGFNNIGQGGGSTTQPAMTSSMIVDDDTANTRTLQNLPSGKTFADVETSVNGGTSYTTHTANAFSIGNVALAIGQVLSRFKTNGSVLAGTPIANTVAFTVSGGGSTGLLTGMIKVNAANGLFGPATPEPTFDVPQPNETTVSVASGTLSLVPKYTILENGMVGFKILDVASSDFSLGIEDAYDIKQSFGVGFYQGDVYDINNTDTVSAVHYTTGDYVFLQRLGTQGSGITVKAFKTTDGVTFTELVIPYSLTFPNFGGVANPFFKFTLGANEGTQTIKDAQGKLLQVYTPA